MRLGRDSVSRAAVIMVCKPSARLGAATCVGNSVGRICVILPSKDGGENMRVNHPMAMDHTWATVDGCTATGRPDRAGRRAP
jgi:hypothetical protein